MPKRIGLMVEPTPFIHVSGYSNRFNEMLKYLNKAGDDVEIVTPDNGPSAPTMAHGFTVNNIPAGDPPRVDAIAPLRHRGPELEVPERPPRVSYHTHLPVYAWNYANSPDWTRTMGPDFCEWLSWKVLRMAHSMADLTLVTSPQIAAELTAKGV